MGFAQETCMLSRRQGAVAENMRERYERRDSSFGRRQLVDHGTVGRAEIARVAQADVVQGRGMGCEAVVSRRVVIFHLMANAPDQWNFFRHPSHSRQTLPDSNSRSLTWARAKLP